MSLKQFKARLENAGDLAGWTSIPAFLLIFTGAPLWPFLVLFGFFVLTWIIRPGVAIGALMALFLLNN